MSRLVKNAYVYIYIFVCVKCTILSLLIFYICFIQKIIPSYPPEMLSIVEIYLKQKNLKTTMRSPKTHYSSYFYLSIASTLWLYSVQIYNYDRSLTLCGIVVHRAVTTLNLYHCASKIKGSVYWVTIKTRDTQERLSFPRYLFKISPKTNYLPTNLLVMTLFNQHRVLHIFWPFTASRSDGGLTSAESEWCLTIPYQLKNSPNTLRTHSTLWN